MSPTNVGDKLSCSKTSKEIQLGSEYGTPHDSKNPITGHLLVHVFLLLVVSYQELTKCKMVTYMITLPFYCHNTHLKVGLHKKTNF